MVKKTRNLTQRRKGAKARKNERGISLLASTVFPFPFSFFPPLPFLLPFAALHLAPLRENFFPKTALLLAFLLALSICPPAMAADNGEGNDMTAVKEYLATQYRGKTWEQGPARLRNGAIDTAYPDWRFYYVFSSQQPAPRVGWISVVLRIGREGRVTEVSGAGSANKGLMKIRGGPDAKIAAAAVMSLSFGPFGPVLVSSDESRLPLSTEAGIAWRRPVRRGGRKPMP